MDDNPRLNAKSLNHFYEDDEVSMSQYEGLCEVRIVTGAAVSGALDMGNNNERMPEMVAFTDQHDEIVILGFESVGAIMQSLGSIMALLLTKEQIQSFVESIGMVAFRNHQDDVTPFAQDTISEAMVRSGSAESMESESVDTESLLEILRKLSEGDHTES